MMNSDDIKRLQAASLHDDRTHGQGEEIVIDEYEYDEEGTHLYHLSPDENLILNIYINPHSLDTIRIDDENMAFDIRRCDIDAYITMLQKAKEIMGAAE